MTAAGARWVSIDELVQRYRARDLSPLEVTRAVLDQITAVNDRLRSFVLVLEGRALEEAQDSERRYRAGTPRGPLDGVPISVKDLFDVAGLPTTAASRILAGSVARADSAVMERLRAAGVVMLGKTNLHEFAFGPTGVPSHFGSAVNPWNVAHVAGGSSSGSAAAVAAGLCFGSIGSETGASVRRPAAFCGVVGFKPTAGRISRHGMIPCAWSLDAVGVFARTVSGAAGLVQALAGHDERDPGSSRRSYPELAGDEAGSAAMRIGVPRAYLVDIDDDARQAFTAAVEALKKLGARVEDVDLPGVRFAAITSTLVAATEVTAYHRRWLHERAHDYSDDVRGRLYLGAGITASEYLLGQRARRLIAAEVHHTFRTVDLLVAPTAPGAAPSIDAGVPAIKDRALEVGTQHCNLVRLPSLLGLPTVSVPCGWSAGGLPLGMQLIGRPFEEPTVIRMARAYEAIAPWADRRPPC
jgi:aspartyl-tRNA(Asn)/glutamyl-tRNA(Gln) amidotransferase subunit A